MILQLWSATIKDPLSRVTGVGETNYLVPNTMRIWLDPDKLVKYNMTTLDVGAIKAQNNQVAQVN